MIKDELARRAAAGSPIRIGVVGAGMFGTWLITQAARVRGMTVSVVADLGPDRARTVYETAGRSRDDIVTASSVGGVADAMAAGKAAVVADAALLADCPLDVVVDVTGAPDIVAAVGYRSLLARKHFVTVSSEADVVFGALLRRTADAAGVSYNIAAGDQPALIKELVDFATTLGFEVVSAGKGYSARPSPATPAASAYLSKCQIEMACAANMTGLLPDVPGMHCPRLLLDDVPGILCPTEHGGILSRPGAIDMVNCADPETGEVMEPHLANGVWAVIRSDNPVATTKLARSAPVSKDGRCTLLYRPYHLVGLETPITIAQAAITGHSTTAPLPTPVVDVIAIAKRDLRAGETLDGMGGTAVRGEIVAAGRPASTSPLPYGLADGVTLANDVARGTAVTYADLTRPGASFAWTLRQLQDATVW
jgi:predicted homoserine dehydrogenase-like protein